MKLTTWIEDKEHTKRLKAYWLAHSSVFILAYVIFIRAPNEFQFWWGCIISQPKVFFISFLSMTSVLIKEGKTG